MIELIAIAMLGAFTWWYVTGYQQRGVDTAISVPKANERIVALWDRSEKALREQKLRVAEKSLLSILRLDHKNASAYNRLGVLYAKQKNYDDALECFEIASSLTPTLGSLYNLGLVQYEKEMFQEAANSFERVIDLEPTPQRYVAFAKAQLKLGNFKKVATALEHAAEAAKSAKLYELLAQTYEKMKDHKHAEEAWRQAAIIRAEAHEGQGNTTTQKRPGVAPQQ